MTMPITEKQLLASINYLLHAVSLTYSQLTTLAIWGWYFLFTCRFLILKKKYSQWWGIKLLTKEREMRHLIAFISGGNYKHLHSIGENDYKIGKTHCATESKQHIQFLYIHYPLSSNGTQFFLQSHLHDQDFKEWWHSKIRS